MAGAKGSLNSHGVDLSGRRQPSGQPAWSHDNGDEVFQMRGSLGCLLVLGVAGTLTSTLRAAANEAIQVERATGAESCPDATRLVEQVAAIRNHADLPGSGGYVVSFVHTGELYRATIRTGPNGDSQRVLEDSGATCAALAQATAVTLALLFDSRADAAPEPEPEPAQPTPAAVKPRASNPVLLESPRNATRIDGMLSLGVSGVLGVLRPVAPGFSGEFGLRATRVRAGLGILWVPTQTLELDPGHVDESLLAGTARACLALLPAAGFDVSLCTGLLVGVVEAKSAGFTQNARRLRSWLSVPLELSLAGLSGAMGWELSAAALGSLVHHDFEVDGLGAPYHAPRVGGLVTLRGAYLMPW